MLFCIFQPKPILNEMCYAEIFLACRKNWQIFKRCVEAIQDQNLMNSPSNILGKKILS